MLVQKEPPELLENSWFILSAGTYEALGRRMNGTGAIKGFHEADGHQFLRQMATWLMASANISQVL
jgi:hypothetical protein